MDPAEPDYRDALVGGPAHRRGAGLQPGNRFERLRLHVLGEELDRQRTEWEHDAGAASLDGPSGISSGGALGGPSGSSANDPPHACGAGSLRRVERMVFKDHTKQIINRVAPTSDVPFDWTVNPYRGCEHGCIYCFARPYHEYLGFGCGLDFETKLVAKMEAASLLRSELAASSWRGEPIVMSAITDIYQPIEHSLRLARQCLEVMAECGQPVSTMTKSALVLRDVDLWARLARIGAGRVTITLVTLDAELAQKLEPRATSPAGRLRVIRQLTEAGVPVTVNVAPVIPGLTESEMPRILEACAEAGARRAAWALLRLPYQVKDLFLEWMTRSLHPARATKVESMIRQMRGGKLYEPTHKRHRGRGGFAAQIAQTFDIFCRKHGLNREIRPLSRAHFRRPEQGGQLSLFESSPDGDPNGTGPAAAPSSR